jgi:WD40 repeat protein
VKLLTSVVYLAICQATMCCAHGQTSSFPSPILQTGETGQAWSMDFSPTGAFFAVANDNRVAIWDHERKWLLRQLSGHAATVEAVRYSPDGKTLASASDDGELIIWDIASGTSIKSRRANSSKIGALLFTSKGAILTAGWDDTVRIWDNAGCEQSCILAHTDGSPGSLVISPDEKLMAVGNYENVVTLWRIDLSSQHADVERSFKLPGDGGDDSSFIRGLAFDRFGRLAAVNSSGAVVIQDAQSGAAILERQTGLRLDGIVIAPDGRRLYTAGTAYPNVGRVVSFDIVDGSRAFLSELPPGWTSVGGNPYRSLTISKDGRSLIAAGTFLLEWDLKKNADPAILSLPTIIPVGTTFSPRTDSVIIPLQSVHLFSLLHGNLATLPRTDYESPITTFGIGPTAQSLDGRFIASPGLNRELMRLMVQTCGSVPQDQQASCMQTLMQKPDAPPMMALLVFQGSDLNYLAEFEMDEDPRPRFSLDGTLLLWRTKTGLVTIETACLCNKRRYDVPLPDEGFFDLVLDASAHLVATPQPGTNGNVVQVYDLTSGSIQTLQLRKGLYVRRLAFNSSASANTRALAIGTSSGAVFIWKLNDTAPQEIDGASPVTAIAFSQDGSRVVIGRDSGAIELVSLAVPIQRQEQSKAHASPVDSLSFGFGGRWIASSSLDAIQFWDSSDLHKVGTLIFPFREGTLSWLFVSPQGLFEGEPRAEDSVLWRFSPTLTDVGPVELFARDYFCQGLMKHVLQDPPGKPSVCTPPAIMARNRHLPVVRVTAENPDPSQLVKTSPVKVTVHLERYVAPVRSPEVVKDVRLFNNGRLVKHWA